MELTDAISSIRQSVINSTAELVLAIGIILLILTSIARLSRFAIWLAVATFLVNIFLISFESDEPLSLFMSTVVRDSFSSFIKVVLNIAGLLTCVMMVRTKQTNYAAEFFILLLTIVLGSHFFLMSNNLLITFFSMEIISIGSYLLVGLGFTRLASEGSLKYFLFGSVASAVMLYGFSFLYGITGTLDFSSSQFTQGLIDFRGGMVLIAGAMSLGGFLFKLAAVPFHPWAPDVYQSAPMPVIAFLSVVPKLAGLGALTRFTLAINAFGQTSNDWQTIIAAIAILTITVGNFAALWQSNPKRMMAYSSIAQAGFLLVGLAAFMPQGIQFMLFYCVIYTLMNFLVFAYLQYFELKGMGSIPEFRGAGKSQVVPAIFLLTGLISLTGLPPTAGFTGKLLLFTGLWQSYEVSGKTIILLLLVFGLVNTVVSLFFYLKIPYYAFLKDGETRETQNIITIENLLGFILVLLLLGLFVAPGLLMGWINSVNFVL